MKKKQITERVEREIQAEAAALEEKVEGNPQLDSIEPGENLYAEILEQAEASQEKAGKRIFIHKRPLLAVAVIVVLGVAASVGVSGAKLFVPRVENRDGDDKVNISVENDEEYLEVSEEEAYEEIEEKLGILALRLQHKPKGMELETVHISKDMGEALLEFYYGEHILTIYENKQNESATINNQSDGTVIDSIEHFYLGEKVEIVKLDKNDGDVFYRVQLEYGNAYYYLTTDIELEEFENILQGVFLKPCDFKHLDRII